MAAGGLVIVFVIMILLEREDLRDRLLRLAGRRDLHRTTEAMNDAAQRISRYLLSQLVVNTSCGLPIGIGLTLIGIPNAALWGILVVLLRFISSPRRSRWRWLSPLILAGCCLFGLLC
jgi:predicted PurR-regulated permease PerM